VYLREDGIGRTPSLWSWMQTPRSTLGMGRVRQRSGSGLTGSQGK
jgi:hypothetical protein